MFNFFNKQSEVEESVVRPLDVEEEEETSKVEEYITSLSVCVKQDGTLVVFFTWKDDTDMVAKVSADLVNRLNTGKLETTLYEILLQYATLDVQHAHMVSKIFRELEEYKDEPVVKATDVFRTATQ